MVFLKVVEKLIIDFRNYLKQGEYEKARILVRFFSDLVNTRVISSTSLINLFENLVDVTMEDNIPQVRSDYFVYTVLSALPWVGKELFEKKEQELEQILNTIDSYISKVSFQKQVINFSTLHFSKIFREQSIIIILHYEFGTLTIHTHKKNIWIVYGHK